MNTAVYRYYVLSYSGKGEGVGGYSSGSLGVIAKDVLQAARLAQQLKPGATIWNVSHHGVVDGVAADAEFTLVVSE